MEISLKVARMGSDVGWSKVSENYQGEATTVSYIDTDSDMVSTRSLSWVRETSTCLLYTSDAADE